MEPTAIPSEPHRQDAVGAAKPPFIFRCLTGAPREWLFWSLQTFFWASLGLVGLLSTLAFQSNMPDAKLVILVRVSCGFMLTALLRFIFRHPMFRQRNGLVKWPLAIGCCLGLALSEALFWQVMWVAGISTPGGAEAIGVKLLVVRLFMLATWSSLYFGFHLLENAHAMELRATKAELTAREHELRHLQAQTNPHFLFSALNTVLACKDDPKAVQETTEGLADYLRFLLKETRPLEPLARELDALEKYLTIQAPYFGKELVCRIQCEKAARGVMVPPMMVQPLLEDAFHRRLQAGHLPLQVWVTARIEKAILLVTVSSTTEPASAGSPSPGGVLALEHRLDLLLGPEVGVESLADNGWNRVTIRIPLSINPLATHVPQPPV